MNDVVVKINELQDYVKHLCSENGISMGAADKILGELIEIKNIILTTNP